MKNPIYCDLKFFLQLMRQEFKLIRDSLGDILKRGWNLDFVLIVMLNEMKPMILIIVGRSNQVRTVGDFNQLKFINVSFRNSSNKLRCFYNMLKYINVSRNSHLKILILLGDF